MSKVKILAELPNLRAEERQQVFDRLCELQDQDLMLGVGPAEDEMKLLDQALADFQHDGDRGLPWRQAIREIREISLSHFLPD